MSKQSFFILIIFLQLFACKNKATLSPYNYAMISAHAYEKASSESLPKHIEGYLDFNSENYHPSEDLKYAEEYQLSDDKLLNKSLNQALNLVTMGGYFGRAYINKQNDEIIIAHRGTDIPEEDNNTDDSFAAVMGLLLKTVRDVDDDIAILKGKIPAQYYAAAHFENEVKEKYRKEFSKDPFIVHTGHSLGAILAELCAAQNNTRAVTFESPGSLPLIKKLLQEDNIDTSSFDITIYNVAPNLINSTHTQSGHVIFLNNDNGQKLSINDREFNSVDFKNHSIENIIKLFDPKTGDPIILQNKN